MKTLMNRVVSGQQNAGLTLLHWSGEVIPPRFGRQLSRPIIVRQVKIPALRIVPPTGNEDLFRYAIAAKARSGFWETVVFVALGISAAGALALAFMGV